MKNFLCLFILLTTLPAHGSDSRESGYDYATFNRQMISQGVQALLMCNGLFTSNRTLEQVFAQELAYLPEPIGDASGGNWHVDEKLKAVAVGSETSPYPVMRAVFREGIGCVVMAPDQDFGDVADLPEIVAPSAPENLDDLAWPQGDKLATTALAADIDEAQLEQAIDWAFDRPVPHQDTLSLLVVHRGQLVAERYAAGVDRHTKTRTWSVAKSLAVTLIGLLVDQGQLHLDEPLPFGWLPDVADAKQDPRREITLRHVLNMASGLETVDNNRMEYATGSGLAYWAGKSSVEGARERGLIREPGSHWDYENYDTLLAVYAMKQALGSEKAYRQFPRKALLDRIGMHNTLISTDRFGDFILSSQVYTTARDLARLGLLYLQEGNWQGEQLLSPQWLDFVRTLAPASKKAGSNYGGQFWLSPVQRNDVPKDAYAARGNRGQYVVIIPGHELVIVRRGLDYGAQGFDVWDLTREVVKAFPKAAN